MREDSPENVRYEAASQPKVESGAGMFFEFATGAGGFQPLHWHESLEILYQLNGRAQIFIDGTRYELPKKQMVVINPRQIHAAYCMDRVSMFLYIHLDLDAIQKFMPEYAHYDIACIPGLVTDEQFPAYLDLCHRLEELTRLYAEDVPAFELEAKGMILQIYARLLRQFAAAGSTKDYEQDRQTMDRIHEVIRYVETHYQEPILLADAADLLGLSREYFSRLFTRNMGIPFQRFVSEMRLARVREQLLNTGLPVEQIIAEAGFTNEKHFYRLFREMYGCRPLELRKNGMSH